MVCVVHDIDSENRKQECRNPDRTVLPQTRPCIFTDLVDWNKRFGYIRFVSGTDSYQKIRYLMSLVAEPKWSDSNHAALLKLYLSSFFIGCFGSTRAIPLKMALQASPEHPTREPVSHCRQLWYSLSVLMETAVIFSNAMGSCSGLWGCEVELWRVKSEECHQASCSTYCFFARYGELSHYVRRPNVRWTKVRQGHTFKVCVLLTEEQLDAFQ